MSDDDIRALMLAHGFTIKEGHDDLKPYVYSAARAVERAARAAAFREAAEVCEALATEIEWRDGIREGAGQLGDALRARAEGRDE